jgi:hypothetical protein
MNTLPWKVYRYIIVDFWKYVICGIWQLVFRIKGLWMNQEHACCDFPDSSLLASFLEEQKVRKLWWFKKRYMSHEIIIIPPVCLYYYIIMAFTSTENVHLVLCNMFSCISLDERISRESHAIRLSPSNKQWTLLSFTGE